MVYESIKKSMEPLKIYDEHAQTLDTELRVFAAETELLYTRLDSMFKERFIGTAVETGLSVYEELFGPERTGESVVRRREMLKLRMNLGEGDFTPAGIRKALDSLGVTCILTEYPTLDTLDITAISPNCTSGEQAFIEREVAKIVPAHLCFQITFNTLTWSSLDALNRTFAAFDAEDLTWKQIDNRT